MHLPDVLQPAEVKGLRTPVIDHDFEKKQINNSSIEKNKKPLLITHK